MIASISTTPEAQITGKNTETAKAEVNDDFLEMLSEKFLKDDIPDAYQDQHCVNPEPLSLKNFSINGLQKSIKQDFSSFQSMLDEALENAGISKDPAFEVKMSTSGELYLISDHPDKEVIEKILNKIPNLKDTFNRIQGNTFCLAGMKQSLAFNKAYEIDPESAVAKYSYIFNEKPCDIFSVLVSEDEYTPNLIRYGKQEYMEVFDEISNYAGNMVNN